MTSTGTCLFSFSSEEYNYGTKSVLKEKNSFVSCRDKQQKNCICSAIAYVISCLSDFRGPKYLAWLLEASKEQCNVPLCTVYQPH